MYKLELDYMDASKAYIYYHSEYAIKFKIMVHNDFELAHRILKFLNKEEEKVVSE